MPSQEQLKKYADVLLRVGLNIQSGQPLVINAPIETAPFVRILTERAYVAGASRVSIHWHDALTERVQLQMESEENLQHVPRWFIARADEVMEENSASLHIAADNPDVFKDVPPQRLSLRQRAIGEKLRHINQKFMEDEITWLVASMPTADWAKKMYSELPTDEAIEKLWDTIFTVMRMNAEDPILAWQTHLNGLKQRAAFLNEKHFAKLHYTAPGTDLWITLPETHRWQAADSVNAQGTTFTANLPTEEVYTLPYKYGVEGTVVSTMPLSHNGVIIENIQLRFEGGRIVEYHASRGEETLKEIIELDDGSHYLGEVALVPISSPIYQLQQLFYNTLFDENASCHLAIGKAYPTCLTNGKGKSEQELIDMGVNDSLNHVDFMIGSDQLNIDGVTQDNQIVPLFQNGEWVI
ncbi:aminopeptidase [Alicyclobacillus tolerans]|uniref:Aminopeptidase II. Metallo peptidase. MEROPS family M29 n=2 Tax=Alicyclobacillus tolerans TaxID=90970 RepID=A0A1M6V7W4_9BACL|nr:MULTISPECIES: aminopeptidase [Alicyclobacillus]MDP9728992.1 aminopeptidase [Alicyclobacillus tengchongensis]SHK77455.1 aminopeptidase II. Metallo peptidase. MEROPS family M29 [Alicyclobacillus montanus]